MFFEPGQAIRILITVLWADITNRSEFNLFDILV